MHNYYINLSQCRASTGVVRGPSRRAIGVKIVVDAYAWIEAFRGSDEGRSAVDVLPKALEVYTPGTVLGEIARKCLREGQPTEETRARLRRIAEASQVVGIDCETALLSAEGDIELRDHARSRGLGRPACSTPLCLAPPGQFLPSAHRALNDELPDSPALGDLLRQGKLHLHSFPACSGRFC